MGRDAAGYFHVANADIAVTLRSFPSMIAEIFHAKATAEIEIVTTLDTTDPLLVRATWQRLVIVAHTMKPLDWTRATTRLSAASHTYLRVNGV